MPETPDQMRDVLDAVALGRPLIIAGEQYVHAPVPRDGLQLPGVWAAYYHDRSAVWICASEIEALRLAVEKSATAGFWPFGVELNEIEGA